LSSRCSAPIENDAGLKVNTQATSAPQPLPIAVQHDASRWKTSRLFASDADAGTPREGFLLATARPASQRGEVRAFQSLVELRQIAMQDLLEVHLSARHLALERLQ
jgi:hypothetical protein